MYLDLQLLVFLIPFLKQNLHLLSFQPKQLPFTFPVWILLKNFIYMKIFIFLLLKDIITVKRILGWYFFFLIIVSSLLHLWLGVSWHLFNCSSSVKVSVAQSCPTLWDPMDCSQAPLSMEFSRQEYWSGLPFPSPGDLSNPRVEPRFPAFQADSIIWATREAHCSPIGNLFPKSLWLLSRFSFFIWLIQAWKQGLHVVSFV